MGVAVRIGIRQPGGIGTGHLLPGRIRQQGGIAAEVLLGFDVSMDGVRSNVHHASERLTEGELACFESIEDFPAEFRPLKVEVMARLEVIEARPRALEEAG